MKKLYFLIFTFIFFTGCIKVTPASTNLKPSWLENKLLSNHLVVGYAKPVFGGIYIQRQFAIADAKMKLGENIRTIISAKKEKNLNIFGENVSLNSIENIESFSKIILDDIKIYDSYINKNKELFLLVGLKDAKIRLKTKVVKAFNKKSLESSTCYAKNILSKIITKSTIYQNKPLWFYSQNEHESIGIAQKIDEDFEMQKRKSITLAKINLLKKSSSFVSSKMKLMKILKYDEEGVLLSNHSHQNNKKHIGKIKLKDIWLDTKSCELYVLILEI